MIDNVYFKFMPLSTDLIYKLRKGVFYFVGFASWFDNQLAGELSSGMWVVRESDERELWRTLEFDL